jgi:long-chain acyl-CoA synthetase
VGLHRHYVAAGLQLYEWTKSAKKPWVDNIMLPLPLFHVYANVGVQPMAFVGPNPLSLVPNPRDIDDVLATIKRVKPAFFNGVPTLYNAILNHPDVRAGKGGPELDQAVLLRRVGSHGRDQEAVRSRDGRAHHRGLLAHGRDDGVLRQSGARHEQDWIDRRPIPTWRCGSWTPEDGTAPMPTGEVGELILRAPQYMAEYWNNPLETADTLRQHDGETWLHTGDLAYMDEDGYLFLVDRKKDLIKTSGFQVWPREIEEVISALPAVLEVGVAGVPDPMKGEIAKGVGRAQARARAPPRTTCAPTAASGWRLTKCQAASSSAASSRRRWSQDPAPRAGRRRPRSGVGWLSRKALTVFGAAAKLARHVLPPSIPGASLRRYIPAHRRRAHG